MATGTPGMRRVVLQAVVSALEDLPEPMRSEVSDACGAKHADRGIGLSWVDAVEYQALVDAIFDAIGELENQRLFDRVFGRLNRGPLLRAIVDGALRMHGVRPNSIMKYASKGWSLLSRELGTLQVVDGERSIDVLYRGFPVAIDPRGIFAHGFVGTYQAVLTRCDVVGSCEVLELDPSRGDARLRMHW